MIGHTKNFSKAMAIMTIAVGVVIFQFTKAFTQGIPATITVTPKVSTSPVAEDADDPAIWIHPTDPAKSVIIGTDKGKNKGGLYVWDLNGRQLQYIQLVHPNNVDVRYGMKLAGRLIDIAVVNVRDTKELKVYLISRNDGTLADITTNGGIKTPGLDDPYGLCLYRRPSDGAMFVIESTKTGATKNLYQYRLQGDGTGKVKGTLIRTFGNNSIKDKVEGLVADDELGYVYAADEGSAVRKYYADPDRKDDNQIVAFATGDGIVPDREGLSIYQCAGGKGYILLSSQGNTTVKVYRREGENGDPHKHTLITTIRTNGSSDTDGLDVTNCPSSTKFPKGFLVTHDSPGRKFNLYAWEDIAQNFLTMCPDDGARTEVETDNAEIIPAEFELEQNYPNPVQASVLNSSTMIAFHLEQTAQIKLIIMNLLGQTVRTLIQGQTPAGEYRVRWNGYDDGGHPVPSGTYLYRIENGDRIQTKKLVLVK
jgi:3-phytase